MKLHPRWVFRSGSDSFSFLQANGYRYHHDITMISDGNAKLVTFAGVFFWGAGGLHYTGAWKGLREPRWDTQPSDLPEATAQCSDMVEMCERSLCWTIFSQRLASMPTSTDIRQIWKFWRANYQYWGINLDNFASGDVFCRILQGQQISTPRRKYSSSLHVKTWAIWCLAVSSYLQIITYILVDGILVSPLILDLYYLHITLWLFNVAMDNRSLFL